jgi:hypothetical protein
MFNPGFFPNARHFFVDSFSQLRGDDLSVSQCSAHFFKIPVPF